MVIVGRANVVSTLIIVLYFMMKKKSNEIELSTVKTIRVPIFDYLMVKIKKPVAFIVKSNRKILFIYYDTKN